MVIELKHPIFGFERSNIKHCSTHHYFSVLITKFSNRTHFIFYVFFFLLGGLGRDGNVLHSAEFYDIQDKKWSQVSSLKVGRTEHVMALVYGIPTVIGGKNSFRTTMKRILLYFALWGKILEQIRSFFCVLEELSFYCFHTY